VRARPILILTLALVAGSSHLAAQLRSRVELSGLVTPVAAVQDPIDRSIWFIVQQNGHIRVAQNGNVLARDFLDLSGAIVSGGEQGLLDMVFSPDTQASGRFFVNFTNRSGHTVVARFRRTEALVADPSSRFDLRWGGPDGEAFIAQPFVNHNGGHLVFGPDGMLYVGMGDGGSADDPSHRAQDPQVLLGKMLRVDVNVPDSHPTGYAIPPDNPFLDRDPVAARGEIWSFGLRNPWRYSFDDPRRGGTGALVIGDVGQNQWEEVDYEPSGRSGRNYGWRNREGAHDHVTSRPPAYTPLVDPIHEYDHSVGQSITGGFVYRAATLGASFRGRYFFADFIQGRVWSLMLNVDPGTREATASGITEHTADLSNAGALGNISSFSVDADGELFMVGYSTGRLLRIINPSSTPATPSGLHVVP